MKLRLNKKAIPRSWKHHPHAKGLVAEGDLSPLAPGRRGRLKAKLLIFDTPASMSRFWKLAVGQCLGRKCLGFVSPMSFEEWSADGGKRLWADPRYFCVIGLSLDNLGMTIISHESVHAGFCYEKRVQRNMFGAAGAFDEERIAYPAGYIASSINAFCHDNGLFQETA